MDKLNLSFEVCALDKHKNLVKTIFMNGKRVIEEEAPTAYVHYIEQCDFWANKFIFIIKNIPIEFKDDIEEWIETLKKCLR